MVSRFNESANALPERERKDYLKEFLDDPAVARLSEFLQQRGHDPEQVRAYLIGLYNNDPSRPALSDMEQDAVAEAEISAPSNLI